MVSILIILAILAGVVAASCLLATPSFDRSQNEGRILVGALAAALTVGLLLTALGAAILSVLP